MIHTSESLKAQDSELQHENYHYQLEDGEQYKLTESELGWLAFVDGRYSIADHLRDNMSSKGVYTVDCLAMSEALEADSIFCKAVCLNDDTALQHIFFYSSIEPEANPFGPLPPFPTIRKSQ
jgi:hypothetical protein